MIKRLILRWQLRRTPNHALAEQYETLIRLARRCAYDLCHTADDLKEDSYFHSFMPDRARHWAKLFAVGNPGKDYRLRIQMDLADAEDGLATLIQLCDEKGVEVPDRIRGILPPF